MLEGQLHYLLTYTDECGTDQEKDIIGWTGQSCYDQFIRMVAGNEGLWTGISLSDDQGNEVVVKGDCWF